MTVTSDPAITSPPRPTTNTTQVPTNKDLPNGTPQTPARQSNNTQEKSPAPTTFPTSSEKPPTVKIPTLQQVYPCLDGKYTVNLEKKQITWSGEWAMSEALLKTGPKSPFKYSMDLSIPGNSEKLATATNGFPVGGDYSGSFTMAPLNQPAFQVQEPNLALSFNALEVGKVWTVKGTGVNKFGTFTLSGNCIKNGKDFQIKVTKQYTPNAAPKAKRSRSRAKPRSKSPIRTKVSKSTKRVPAALTSTAIHGLPIRRQSSQRELKKPSHLRREEEQSRTEALSQPLSRCLAIIKQLMATRDAAPFCMKVDTTLVPDYLDVIKRPMHLDLIKNRIIGGYYTVEKSTDERSRDRANKLFHEHDAMQNPTNPLGENYAGGHEGINNDVNLVCENAFTYNQVGSIYRSLAESTQQFWAKKYAAMLRQVEKARMRMEEKERKEELERQRKEGRRAQINENRRRKRQQSKSEKRKRPSQGNGTSKKRKSASRNNSMDMDGGSSSSSSGGGSGYSARELQMMAKMEEMRKQIERIQKHQAREVASKRMDRFAERRNGPNTSSRMPPPVKQEMEPSYQAREEKQSQWTFEDKEALADQISQLPEEKLSTVVSIIYDDGYPENEDEVEIDLQLLNDAKLRRLQQYVEKARKEVIKEKNASATGEEHFANVGKAMQMRLEEIDSELSAMASDARKSGSELSHVDSTLPNDNSIKKEIVNAPVQKDDEDIDPFADDQLLSGADMERMGFSLRADDSNPVQEKAKTWKMGDKKNYPKAKNGVQSNGAPEGWAAAHSQRTSSQRDELEKERERKKLEEKRDVGASDGVVQQQQQQQQQPGRKDMMEEARKKAREEREKMTRTVDMEAQSNAMQAFANNLN